MSTEIFGKTVTNAAEALLALRGACSTSKDDDGITYVWAGYLSGQEPGDGTRECEMLVEAGIFERDTDEDGEYHVYRVVSR